MEALKKEQIYRCKHYFRKCNIFAPCCDKEFSCRLCHDQEYGKPNACTIEKMD